MQASPVFFFLLQAINRGGGGDGEPLLGIGEDEAKHVDLL